LINYSELHCLTNYSFLRGASHPHELVVEAKKNGYQAIAITDECSLSGIVKAWKEAKQQQIKLIVGSEFLIETNSSSKEQIKLLLLAMDRQGYQQISSLISLARRRSDKGNYSLLLNDLIDKTSRCLFIIKVEHDSKQQWVHQISLHARSRLWLGVSLLSDGNDQRILNRATEISRLEKLPIVACGNVHMHNVERKPLQDLLTAIRIRTPIMDAGSQLFKNAENHLRHLNVIKDRYPSELIEQTMVISQLCHFDLAELRYNYPKELVPQGESPASYLRRLSYQGAAKRWPKGIPPHVKISLDRELQIIQELAYEHYFLTVYDIVAYARRHFILCQGRGSAANSVVCYCLMITEVDPAQSELLFERFISKERNEPPDIDVDFEHERREEVIQYIYNKYSRERAALAATVITYRPRSAIRDVGKALNLDPLLIEKLASSMAWWDSKSELIKRFQEAKVAVESHMAELFLSLVNQIMGFPRHLSQHVGGFIITESPISHLVPLENASMPDRTIIQWDKYDIEALGLLKIDVLALGMLTAIRKAIDLINSYMELPISMADIPDEDPKTYAMLCRGDSIGVFQVESRAQIAMLPRLKPSTFYDLVIEVAIVRPGPIQGDMVHPYLKRREGTEIFDYPNEEVKKVLQRTLGVPIFQEQVIKLAMVAAGFSGGEADQLRRAMAAWKRTGELEQFREKLINGMLARGHSQEFAERVYKQMQGFGEYGFPESHAASFALLVYVSAWLKCHYPAAFYCGLLNSQPMGFYTPSQLVQDAIKHHVEVLPSDIRYSDWSSSLENIEQSSALLEVKPSIRLGLRRIKGLSESDAINIIEARKQQPFVNIQDLAQRARLDKGSMEKLIAANACEYLAGNRHQGLWQAAAIESHKPLLNSIECANNHVLQDGVKMPQPSVEEDMLADYASTGLTLGPHPLKLLRSLAPFKDCKTAESLPFLREACHISVAGLVTCRQRPSTATGVLFITLEDETGNINVVVWENLQKRFRQALLKSQILLIKGKMERKNSVVHIIAGYAKDMSESIRKFNRSSRDFH
jgi:error-prone DNA polymerase